MEGRGTICTAISALISCHDSDEKAHGLQCKVVSLLIISTTTYSEKEMSNWMGEFETTEQLLEKLLETFTKPGAIVVDMSKGVCCRFTKVQQY